MPKNIEDIIVPERKRSIRNIPIPEGRRRNDGNGAPLASMDYHRSEIRHQNLDQREEEEKPPRISRKGVWIATAAAFLVLIFAVLSIFDEATLSYVPKSAAVSFADDAYTAEKTGEGKLLYSVIKLSENKGLEASASGDKEVSRKASGTIIVYNNTTEPQRLRATTRFETLDGKVYQVQDAIVIPAKKTVSGTSKPGTLEIMVYAENPGAEYNTGLSDFTLPGLKGTSLSSEIYARSKTEMSGGFIGVEKTVSEQDQALTKDQLKTILKDELIAKAKLQAPEGFILLPSLSLITFEDLPQTNSTSKNSAVINMRGNLQGVMFKRNDLSTHLASEKTSITTGETVNIPELELTVFSFIGAVPTDLLLSDKLEFSVTGSATVVWNTDETALRADLVGKHKKDVQAVLNNYSTITQATATLRPFWKRSFPEDSTRISLDKLDVK